VKKKEVTKLYRAGNKANLIAARIIQRISRGLPVTQEMVETWYTSFKKFNDTYESFKPKEAFEHKYGVAL
jgi:hypothetical protein